MGKQKPGTELNIGGAGYQDDDMDLVSVDGRQIEKKFTDDKEMHVRDDNSE